MGEVCKWALYLSLFFNSHYFGFILGLTSLILAVIIILTYPIELNSSYFRDHVYKFTRLSDQLHG